MRNGDQPLLRDWLGIGGLFVLVFIFLFCLSKWFWSQPMSSVLLSILCLIPLGGMSKQLCDAELPARLNHNTFLS